MTRPICRGGPARLSCPKQPLESNLVSNSPKAIKTDAEWRQHLSPEQYRITLRYCRNGTALNLDPQKTK